MFEKLKAPFDPAKVSWRVGSMTKDKKKGMALAYIDARDVMERLDDVCGPAGWACRYPHATGKTVCAIGIKIGEEWIWKEDGAGDSDIEAEKGALSDAFKRAAVRWGIGRYLYDIASPWVELDEYKHILPTETGKLHKALGIKPTTATRAAASNDDPFAEVPARPATNITPISERARATAPHQTQTKPAPPVSNTVADYIIAFETKVRFCESMQELDKSWTEETKNRAQIGIVKDSDAYKRLADIARARKGEIEAEVTANLRAG